MNLTRRQARELAFQFLYGFLPAPNPKPEAGEPASSGASGGAAPDRKDLLAFCQNYQQPFDEFAWELIQGTGKYLPALDDRIRQASVNWRIERMPRVDLTILRLAAGEILFRPDIPKSVAINEAVELAKKFGAEESAAFVNGILDKFEKPAVQ